MEVEKGNTPPGVERIKRQNRNYSLEIVTYAIQPGGAPNPSKPHDSVQANLISRLCAAKKEEEQIPAEMPSLLVIDLTHFGPWPESLKLDQASPLISGHGGLTSGAFWYAFFGWKGAPIFEEGHELNEHIVRMGHDGRFRLSGTNKSKLSGVMIVVHEACVLFENPWAITPLPPQTRRLCERFPWFEVSRSICEWSQGDAAMQIELGKRQIEFFESWQQAFAHFQS